MYADYDYYSNEYGGSLTETQYTPLAKRTEVYIDAKTNSYFVDNSPDKDTSLYIRLQMCACALADEMYNSASGINATKSSEKTGNYSVSYAVGTVKSDDERLADVLKLYLFDIIKAVDWV